MRSAPSERLTARDRQAGSVTAELAVTFPVVVLALAVVLFAGSVAQAGVTCADAARAAGRVLARGDTAGAARATAAQVAGRPVTVQVGGVAGAGPAAAGPRAAGPAAAGAAGGGVRGGSGTGGGVVEVTVRLDAGAAFVPAWGDPAAWSLPVTCRARAWAEPTS